MPLSNNIFISGSLLSIQYEIVTQRTEILNQVQDDIREQIIELAYLIFCFAGGGIWISISVWTVHGLIQVYTGDGKGKTTAAFGLAVRAAGWGKKVLIYQFLKPETLELGERKFIAALNGRIALKVLDESWNMWNSFGDAGHVAKVKERISKELGIIAKIAGDVMYDVIILDEIVFCQSTGLAEIEDIQHIIDNKRDDLELIMTGRGATKEMIKLADLVSEIKPIKHPYDSGVPARKGIEF